MPWSEELPSDRLENIKAQVSAEEVLSGIDIHQILRGPQQPIGSQFREGVEQIVLPPDDGQPAVLIKALRLLDLGNQRDIKCIGVFVLQVHLQIGHIGKVYIGCNDDTH